MLLCEIQIQYASDISKLVKTQEMSEDLFDALYEYYLNSGEMPYGVAKARDGDPMEWVCDRFESYLGLH